VVAGDHHRPDARRPAPADRFLHLRARRVDHAHHADKDQVLFDGAFGVVSTGLKAMPSTRMPVLGQVVVGLLMRSAVSGASSGTVWPDPDLVETSSRLSTAPLVKPGMTAARRSQGRESW
jgi:hypothetical protein